MKRLLIVAILGVLQFSAVACSMAWGRHELLPPAKILGTSVPRNPDQVILFREGETPPKTCIRIATVAAHGNGYATRETLEQTLVKEAAMIGAEFVVATQQQVTSDETVGSIYGGVILTDTIKRPHLYGVACRAATVRFGVKPDKDWTVLYVYPKTVAERAGIKEGDRVLSINGVHVLDDQYLIEKEISTRPPGTKVVVEYLTKGGDKMRKEVTLEEWR